MFSCEFYQIFKSTFFTEHFRTTAFGSFYSGVTTIKVGQCIDAEKGHLPETQQIENPTFLVDVLVKDCLSLIVQYNMWYYL